MDTWNAAPDVEEIQGIFLLFAEASKRDTCLNFDSLYFLQEQTWITFDG